ncbi:nck-associated protein 5 isoform X1 [Lissotriton helveticus]
MREKLIHELEEERRLRLECEKRLRAVTLESDRSKAQMHDLQQQFARMEETVRNLLQNQGALEQNGREAADIMKVYQEKMPEEERKRKAAAADQGSPDKEDSRSEFGSIEEEKEKTRLLLERLKTLEAENSALALENENQREQYERCLDEVANQVVQALLTQKDLREECLKLKTRVVDLEEQNQSLSVLFQQRVRPASDKLLQKLHSRILDLSSVDLLTEVERNRSMRQLRSDFQSHEWQQHLTSGIPAIKCHSQLHTTGPSRVYPRSSCSSSELSLSSACSEYSSGSSCTWNDGRTCSKLQSSVSWDKRINLPSSVPRNFSNPAAELPPTRIKECHILEGLKKLQKRKGLLEPHSLMSKWGDKDCMDSNEGIYSPGTKCSSHMEPSACNKLKEKSDNCAGHKKAFAYDSDSHDDADDESSNLALLHRGPNKDCRLHCNKLSHSISDSLFGWEPNEKHLIERDSFFNSKDRPEKLTSFANDFQAEVNSCTRTRLPLMQIEQSLANLDFNLLLSDTDDNEVLDELHIESSDEKSPSDEPLSPFTGMHTQNTDTAAGNEISQFASSSIEGNQGPSPSDMNPKTCNFVKQQQVIKKTSSEECITVIFDAEDGEPIEFCSHQTGVVTVTTNEISLSRQQPSPVVQCAELLPHLVTRLQNDSESLTYAVLETPSGENENNSLNGTKGSSIAFVSTTVSETVSPVRSLPPSPHQQLLTPAYSISCKTSQSISFVPAGGHQNQNNSKIHSKGTCVPPQTLKLTDKAVTNAPPVTMSAVSEKSPSSPPVKLTRFLKASSSPSNVDSKSELDNPKSSANLFLVSKIPSQISWTKDQNSNVAGSLLNAHSVLQPVEYREPPTSDKHVEVVQQETCVQSPPPPPPGRSVSLLIKQHQVHSSPLSMKPVLNIPCEVGKTAPKSLHLKGSSTQVSFPNDKSPKKLPEAVKTDSAHMNTKSPAPPKCNLQQPQRSQGVCQTPPKVCVSKTPTRTCHQPIRSNIQDTSYSGLRTSSSNPATSIPPDTDSPQIAISCKKGKASDSGVPQQDKFQCGILASTHGYSPRTSESSQTQANNPQLPTSSSCNTDMNALPNYHCKALKTRLPVGMKVLVKSPQLNRKSCTVPGKQEKDTINTASKGGITSGKSKSQKSTFAAADGCESAEPETVKSEVHITSIINLVDKVEPASSPVLESIGSLLDPADGFENYIVRRSNSSITKPYLKPALGMNGAKARSQSFSVNVAEKSPTSVCEASGKIRTHIITNTADRGNSLSRQNSVVEAAATRMTPECSTPTSKVPEISYSRQGSHMSMSSSGSQHASPSKLPCRTPPKPDLLHSFAKCEGLRSPIRIVAQSISDSGKLCYNDLKPAQMETRNIHKKLNSVSSPPSCSSLYKVQNTDKLESPTTHDAKMVQREVVSVKSSKPKNAEGVAVIQPTIEEKVMLGIQENVQKGQIQVKSTPTDQKQKTVPSIASWFGFRRSKLPSLNTKKPDAAKAKVEKKDAKSGIGFGNKQMKVEKKKDKNKTELQCEVENKTNKKSESSETERALKMSISKRTSQDMSGPMRCEQNTDTITTTCSAKDIFMKELLNRVDKKAAQQTESGSNNVSYRSVSKGSSQGSSLPGNSISTQGNHKKNSKTKDDMEIQNETMTNTFTGTMCNDQEDTFADSGCQNHIIESSCLMRTLDSGIGTFPLPDSGNRAAGRHPSKQEQPLDTEVFIPLLDALSNLSSKVKTLEREVPLVDRSHESDDSNISHSLSDSVMTAKSVQPFLSRLPKPTSSGMFMPERLAKSQLTPIISSCSEHSEKSSEVSLDHPDWNSLKAAQTQDSRLRVGPYTDSSSSDTERELEYEANDYGTGGGKLLNIKNNKHADQVTNVRTSFIGNPMSIMDFYQQNVYVQYTEDDKHMPHYDFLQHKREATGNDEMGKEICSKLMQANESKEESANTLSQISLESLNKFNRNSLILLEKEKNGLNKEEDHKEENGRDEEVSLSCSDRAGVDNLESLSDSLYDSFSSCASQGSNDV